MVFSKKDIKAIEAAVREAETRTSGEIVPVVVPASGDYSRVSYRLGVVGYLIGTLAAALMQQQFPFSDLLFLLSLQALGAVAGWFIGQLPPVIRALLPSSTLDAEVDEAAFASFARNGLHHTKERTGVLIFISLLEHRVEILADKGIHEKVGDGYWKEEVEKLGTGFGCKKAGATMVQVIHEIGEKLAEHFPHSADDKNELADGLRKS
jgi:putative membrane protein